MRSMVMRRTCAGSTTTRERSRRPEVVGLHRVIGRLEPRNRGSARVLEKLGMRREAHLVENEWVKGEWQSELVYAMLACEWRGGSAGTEPGDDRY